MRLTRRQFVSAAVATSALAADSRYSIGITTNTRGGWEKDVWLSFREAREVGYRNVESFIHYFNDFIDFRSEGEDRPAALQKKVDDIGVRFVTISNGGPMEMHFEDPSRHEKIIREHLRLVRFIKGLGCKHLKINMGPRRETGTTAEDLKHMAAVLNEIGRRSTDEGIRFAVHAHMWSQFENRREIQSIMANTDPRHVWFVLDTGHITMAGIDPVELTRTLGHRIVEFHIKDTKPEYRGGARSRLEKHDPMNSPVFMPLGAGGVDFPALKEQLDRIKWQGWLTVELDSSPFRPPKDSAKISSDYLEKTLKLAVS